MIRTSASFNAHLSRPPSVMPNSALKKPPCLPRETDLPNLSAIDLSPETGAVAEVHIIEGASRKRERALRMLGVACRWPRQVALSCACRHVQDSDGWHPVF